HGGPGCARGGGWARGAVGEHHRAVQPLARFARVDLPDRFRSGVIRGFGLEHPAGLEAGQGLHVAGVGARGSVVVSALLVRRWRHICAVVPGLTRVLTGALLAGILLIGTVLIGTVLIGTVLIGTVLLGTVLIGTGLVGTVLVGAVLGAALVPGIRRTRVLGILRILRCGVLTPRVCGSHRGQIQAEDLTE